MIMQLTGDIEALPLVLHKEKEDIDSYRDNSSGGGISPPLSPPQAPSPPPTMVPHSTAERSPPGSRSVSSPGTGGMSNLHHALHGLHNLHNLHNLHSLQNLQTQMAALASLQGSLGGATVNSLLHSHLSQQHPDTMNASLPNNNTHSGSQSSSPSGSVPQMVLTAGQVPQSVQGAQLLIPTSQGIAVQPILTIPLGQAGPMSSSSLVNPLSSFHNLPNSSQHPPSHHQSTHPGSTTSSPLPNSSSSSTSSSTAPHSLLGLAGLPPSLFHQHGGHNNNNNSTNNNNNIVAPDQKPKLSMPMSSPAQDAISGLSARIGGGYPAPHHLPPPSRYSPDFLDTHNQPTINQTTGNVVDGVNLDEIKEFAKAFKIRRLSLGLTQTQVGQALSITEGPAYSQSAICRYKNGHHTLTDFMGNEPSKKRKRRTSFTPQALEVLNAHFERNTHPSGAEITAMGEQLGYEREVVRIWFCNKRQALKNTVRMMQKAPQPPPPPHSALN